MIEECGDGELITTTNGWKSLPIDESEYSSSLLRICKYPGFVSIPTSTDASDPSISFGSHTDTSFLTIGLIGAVSGMEIFDIHSNSWVAVESDSCIHRCEHISYSPVGERVSRLITCPNPSPRMVVFSGEFLQILTGHRFTAAVHRVRTPEDLSLARISCPFIIRGRDKAVVGVPVRRTSSEVETTGAEGIIAASNCSLGAAQIELPDLSGTTMKLLHKLLDFKRSKCMKANDGNTEDWVLKAF